MDDYYERLNQAFANWNGGGEPSLEDRVDALESEMLQKQDILTFDSEPVKDSENPVTSGGLFSQFERYALESEMLQKQDILTFDSEPVKDSENPVTSGGLFSQFERYATKTALDEKVDTSNFTADQNRQETEMGVIANAGAKNLLDYTFSINGNTSARVSNGVTFTINADGSISTSGTASANITSAWIQQNYAVPDDPVILSGCPTGGANNKYRIDILDGSPSGSVVASDYGDGVVIKSSMFTNGTGLIRIRIEKNQNADGLVFKPMIRPATITDSTFVPYAPTNRELYEMILALQSGS